MGRQKGRIKRMMDGRAGFARLAPTRSASFLPAGEAQRASFAENLAERLKDCELKERTSGGHLRMSRSSSRHYRSRSALRRACQWLSLLAFPEHSSQARSSRAAEPVARIRQRADAAEHDQHQPAEPGTYPAGDSDPWQGPARSCNMASWAQPSAKQRKDRETALSFPWTRRRNRWQQSTL